MDVEVCGENGAFYKVCNAKSMDNYKKSECVMR